MRRHIMLFVSCFFGTALFGQLTTLVGIGVRLQIDSTSLPYKAAKVTSFLPGGPAGTSGLKVGDFVLKVDGKNATNLNVDGVVALIKGPEGTAVKLEVKRGAETKTFSMTRKAIQASSSYYTSSGNTEFGKNMELLLNDAPYDFKNTIDSTTFETEGTGFTRDVYPSRIKLPGVKSVHMVRSFGTTCRIRVGVYNTMDEVNKNGEKFVEELQKCFPKFYFFPVAGKESNKVQIGNQNDNGYTSALMEMYSFEENGLYYLDLRIENGSPSYFYKTTTPVPETDFARAIHKIYKEVPNKFAGLKGTEHEEGGPFNTAYWYDSNMEVPGSGKSYIFGGSAMISTPLRFISLFYNGPSLEKANEAFVTMADVVREAFGDEFVFSGDRPNEILSQVIPKDAGKFVIFARRKERGYEKVPVAVLMVAPSEGGNYSLSLVFYETAL
ncbi:MAG: PDZ domain-containing protein [Bacteroidota bacterium]